jgi:uncharacterized C2H2 Zn-finger protein
MNHDELRAVLAQALAEREAQAAKVRAAIAALDGAQQLRSPAAEPAPQLRPAPRPKTAKPAKRGGDYVCTECGQTFNRPNGLSRHMNQTHGQPNGARPRTLAVLHPAPALPPANGDGPLVLRCGQCGDEFPIGGDAAEALQQMRHHCRDEHDRSPNEIDRRPRPAQRLEVES